MAVLIKTKQRQTLYMKTCFILRLIYFGEGVIRMCFFFVYNVSVYLSVGLCSKPWIRMGDWR
jgi:hypothetical protein